MQAAAPLYHPYSPQRRFHDAGARYRERLFMAGNQLGKSLAGAEEVAAHLTGQYPDWWAGRRWMEPTRWWVASDTAETTRDSAQRLLVGPPFDERAWGSAALPREALKSWHRGRAAGALTALSVAHASGGLSGVVFKSYDQGRARWQGETLDGLWFDEEPPLDIYIEGLTRTNATGGFALVTFTPLKGMSDVVRRFLADADRA